MLAGPLPMAGSNYGYPSAAMAGSNYGYPSAEYAATARSAAGAGYPGAPPAGAATALPPQRAPRSVPHGAPPIPDMALPSQSMMDSAPEDGPLSAAFKMQRSEGQIHALRPSPHTHQYLHRGADRRDALRAEQQMGQPRRSGDICGWVVAAADPLSGAPQEGRMQVPHNELKLVFQCVSAWVLMFWKSKDDFEAGIHGGRRAPRCLGWFDLRRAYDVRWEAGNPSDYVVANRISVLTTSGNVYFCVELPEDAPLWYNAIRRVIQDASLQRVSVRDTELHQRKRWAAACGVAAALERGTPIGERAMAILFHCYDMDYDCVLRIGELMVLIRELLAAVLHDEGHAEGADRDTAVFSSQHRIPDDELFDRAMRMRRQCDPHGCGKVSKTDFVTYGAPAMYEALGVGGTFSDLGIQMGGNGAGEYYDGLDRAPRL